MTEQEMKRGALWSEVQFLTGLSAALDKSPLDQMPDVHLMGSTTYVKWNVWGPQAWELRNVPEEDRARVKREAIEAKFALIVDLFPGAVWEKNDPSAGKYGADYYELSGTWEKVTIAVTTYRKDVCEAVVVLEHDVTSEVPDPELVAKIPLITVTEKKQVVEWQCNPVIAEKTDPLFRRIPAEELTA